MTQEEIHQRTMNLNAHFAMAIAFWGSADFAMQQGNFLLASIGFYYSTFHAGFSLLNIDPTMHLEHLRRTSHSTLEKKLKNHLDIINQNRFKLLRTIRENINYLGMEAPQTKLMVIRGHTWGFDFGEKGHKNFFELVPFAQKESKLFIRYCLAKIEDHCSKNELWRCPKINNWDWYDEYLQEDSFTTIIPQKNRAEILQRALCVIIDNNK